MNTQFLAEEKHIRVKIQAEMWWRKELYQVEEAEEEGEPSESVKSFESG